MILAGAEAAAASDPRAWDWSAARERCLREAHRIVPSPEAAEDVVQAALLRAWRHRAACRNPTNPVPWLLAITRREAFRFLARTRAASEDLTDAIADAPDVHAEDAHDAMLTWAALVAVLSAEDLALVQLRFAEDRSYGDIADQLAWPEGTVATRLHRLRRGLRTHFDQPP